MGDFSRDTFKLTNVMHQFLSSESVVNARHYVGVKMQQGVPLLDSDWNEMDDIRRAEMRALTRFFIGSGIPENSQAFAISGSGTENDFTINLGVAIVNGYLLFIPSIVTYSTQPLAGLLPPLITPPINNNRRDLVYLDVWEEEISASNGSVTDSRLVNQSIGIETTTRILRHWVVRVLEGIGDVWDIPSATDSFEHAYMELAFIQRRENVASISDQMIIDRRNSGLTLADHLKVPLFVSRSIEQVDSERYAQALANLRSTLFRLLRDAEIPYAVDPGSAQAEIVIISGLQQLLHLTLVGENQALSGGLNNRDALSFLNRLYQEQSQWLDLVSDLGNDGGAADAFITRYRSFLTGNPSDPSISAITNGLLPAIEASDLLAAVLAQESINSSFGGLLSGSISVSFLQAIDANANMAVGQATDFIFNVSAFLPSSGGEQTTSTFDVEVLLDSGFGRFEIDNPQLEFESPSDQGTVTVAVTPSGTLPSATFDVLVRSSSNPSIVSPQNPLSLVLGELPPVGSFYIYSGPRFNLDGFFAIPAAALPTGFVTLQFRLINSSPDQTRTFNIVVHLVIDGGSTDDWNWNSTPSDFPPARVVDPDNQVNIGIPITWISAGTPPVGITGNMITTATGLIGDAEESQTLTLPFVVV